MLAQDQDQEELLLSFRHPGIGSEYVGVIYDYSNGQYYLPVLELFRYFEVYNQPRMSDFTVEGNFLSPDQVYKIDLGQQLISFSKEIHTLEQSDFRIGSLDYYLSPKIFETVFGLTFTVNTMQLTLRLETAHKLPIQARREREGYRAGLLDQDSITESESIRIPRKRKWLSGAMLDYNISSEFRGKNFGLSYNLGLGAEILGGDIQGRVLGYTTSEGLAAIQLNNVFWRYVVRDNAIFSNIMLGQMNTTGLDFRPMRGISISNEPVEPRRMYDAYNLDGYTEPDSEVELYLNERLVQFVRADALGYYRFDIPLTYGSSRVRIRIYTPDGQIKELDRQIQVPFNFLPKGVFQYQLQAGTPEQAFHIENSDGIITQGNIAYGVNNWLTMKLGTDYLSSDPFQTKPIVYGNLNARIAKQYLMSMDIAPSAFYRLNGSVLYPSNQSLNVTYTKFTGQGVFNFRNALEEFTANYFLPIQLNKISLGIVLGAEHVVFEEITTTRLRTDLNLRIGRLNLRLNYRDAIFTTNNATLNGEGQLTGALTYNLIRTPGLPVFFHGLFMRGQMVYDTREKQLLRSELQVSKTIKKTGRFNVSVGYNHAFKNATFDAGLIIDFKSFRSTSTLRVMGDQTSFRQSLNGSIGMDIPNKYVTASNREQIGRASASVLLFIDNNGSGKYDTGDELLPHKAFKLDRTALSVVGRDCIIRLNQLQSYHKYTLTINRNVLSDPTLVPLHAQYSIIMDPNQHKRIEIPFYRGGIVEGTIYFEKNGEFKGLGGLRIRIIGQDSKFDTEIRTFSNGGFYAMDIPPGRYKIEVDPVQLKILDATYKEEALFFEIRPNAVGDALENLDIYLVKDLKSSK
ncbi:MAG: fimbria/pilus outer membrane usher protein [Saprospiraceae bacterium]|nr:fimbria/pilus outer membrane usher protein [Saprospiraceae bacterium]